MGRAAVLFVVLALAGCGGDSDEGDGLRPSPKKRLEDRGFFKYADPSKVSDVQKEIDRDAASAMFSLDTNRFFFADAESLAEGGVGDLLRELEPTLRRAGVPALAVEDDFVDDHYDVVVNGKRYRILSESDVRDDLVWGYAGARTVILINDLLKRAGSDDRAYGYQGGNDFGVFLLTPALRDEVAAAISSPAEEPYEMDDQPANFGFRAE